MAQAAVGSRVEEHQRLPAAQVLLTDLKEELAQRSFKLRVAKMPRDSQEAAFVTGPKLVSTASRKRSAACKLSSAMEQPI